MRAAAFCLTLLFLLSSPDDKDVNYLQLKAAKLSGEAASVTNLSLHRDGANFDFSKGDFFFLEPVLGKVPGAVFIGDGQFRMVPTIDIEKKNLSIFTNEPSIGEPFTELVLHFTDNTYDEILKAAAARKEAPNSKAQSSLESRLDLLRKGRVTARPYANSSLLNSNLAARLLSDLYDPAHAGFFNAFIKGKKFSQLMFRVDPRGIPSFEPEEVILASFDDSTMGVWNAFHLKDHYRNEVADEDHRLFDVQNQQIEVTIKGTELSAKVRTTIQVLVDGPRVLSFNLFPTLRVTKVADEDGREVKFIQEPKDEDPDLTLIYAQPLKKGTARLDFEYAGPGAIENDGSGNYTLAARDNWYPATTFGDRATYDMTFKLAKDLTMVASGQPKETREEGNLQITRWTSEIPIAVAGFNFGRFKKSVSKSPSGYEFESYANTGVPDMLKPVEQYLTGTFSTTSLMDKARSEAEVATGIYNTYYGPLPYGRIAMTQQTAPNFGQAWPMLVYMPITSFFDATIRYQLGMQTASDFFKIVGPHEVAHQWWGHIIGWKSYRDQWMSEGFADFSASLFAHLIYKDEKFLDFWKDQRDDLLQKNRFGVRPVDVGSVTMGYRIDSAKTGNIGRNMLYPKGAFILHMLRMMMFDSRAGGDAPFIEMMHDFVKTHFNQNVSTEDFQKIVDKHMTPDMDLGKDHTMNWFFDQFVYGSEVPRYKLDYTLEPQGDKTVLKFRVTQSEVPDSFKMLIPIYVETQDRKFSRLGSAKLFGKSSQDGAITLGFKPRRALLCAYDDVLAIIDGR